MLDAVEDSCTWTTDKIKAIRELMRHTAKFVQRRLPKLYSYELVQLLFQQPYCRIGTQPAATQRRLQAGGRCCSSATGGGERRKIDLRAPSAPDE